MVADNLGSGLSVQEIAVLFRNKARMPVGVTLDFRISKGLESLDDGIPVVGDLGHGPRIRRPQPIARST